MGEVRPGDWAIHPRGWIEATCGARVAGLTELLGGAGERRYWRVHLEGSRTAVLMHALPERPEILPPALRGEREPVHEDPGSIVVDRLLGDLSAAVAQAQGAQTLAELLAQILSLDPPAAQG